MDPAELNDILAEFAEGKARDHRLLRLAAWVCGDGDRIERLRSLWPKDKLPVIDNYFCVTLLGKGASGVVYKALMLDNGPRFVALKLLQFHSEEEGNRFRLREIEILKALDCPNVARYLDSGSAGGMMYLVMELVEGLPLDEHLAGHAVGMERKLGVFRDVCRVVARFHSMGVIHRDLKPGHILIDGRGQPWIVDFGLSAVRGEDWPSRVRRAQTELGHILGTIKYMSPEQAWGGLLKIDQASDIWSLGVMLYEIATEGDYPYDLSPVGEMSGHDALLHRIQTESPKKPKVHTAPYGEALTTLISRCLAYEPERRLESASVLADDLDRCLGRQPIRTKRLPVRYRLQRIAVGLAANWRLGLWSAIVCATLVLLLGVSLVFGVRRQSTGRGFSGETHRVIRGTPALSGPEAVVIVGISDETMEVVPELATRRGWSGVTSDIRSWRAVHGRMMENLAAGRPRAVLWDYYFRTPQAGDEGFVRGVRALDQVGVPVVLAVTEYGPDGKPALSSDLFHPIADRVRHGLILARDMVAREGEFVMALRRGEAAYPTLVLAAFSAIVHPEYTAVIDWREMDHELRLLYHRRGGSQRPPSPDAIELTSVFRNSRVRLGAQAGDILACRAFKLNRPEVWAQRRIPYEAVLDMSPDELAELAGGKIVLFGDVRAPHAFLKRDRFPVRYGAEIVPDVPGCYLIADAISGLLANRYLQSESPLSKSAFVGVAVFAFLACLVPPKVAGREFFGAHWPRVAVVGLLLGGSLVGVAGMVLSDHAVGVHAAMFGTAMCLAGAGSFAIEFARNRFRVPAGARGATGAEPAE